MGTCAGQYCLFNDLSREIVSLFVIPLFMRHFRSTAIGITGATAIDCTLPIIQKAGGIEVTPIAISLDLSRIFCHRYYWFSFPVFRYKRNTKNKRVNRHFSINSFLIFNIKDYQFLCMAITA